MKKLLKLLTVLTLSTTTSSSVVVVCNQSSTTSLNSVLKNPELGIIKTVGHNLPTVDEIKDAIKVKNSNVDISHIKIENIKADWAQITGDGIVYSGFVNVHLLITLDSILKNSYLGFIEAIDAEKPDVYEIKRAIKAKNSNIDISYIKVENITPNSAKVTGDGITYSGFVNVDFAVDKSVYLGTVLKNIFLGKIKDNSYVIPTVDQVKKAIKAKNSNVDITKIKVEDITADWAKVVGDGIVYRWFVNVNFSVTLDSVLKNPELGTIKTNGPDLPTVDQIKKAIKAKNSNVQTWRINVWNITATSAKVTGDGTVYDIDTVNVVNVFFTIDKLVALSSFLKNPELGIIKTVGHYLPTDDDIKKAIKTKNRNVNISHINVDDITATSAKVTGDRIVYSGFVDIHFSVNLNSVLTNSDLGIIKTNGHNLPTGEQVKDVIKTKNNNIDISHIKVKDLTATSATVIGDGIVYSGFVIISFTVNKSDLV